MKKIIRFFFRVARSVSHWFIIKLINFFSIFGNEKITNKIRRLLLTLLKVDCQGDIFIDYGFDCIAPSNISFGKNVSLGHYNKIWAFESVAIGDYVQTAVGLTIIAGTHKNDTFEPAKGNTVTIGNGCWLGANVTIIAGVEIGKGCIIGAGSVVTKNIPCFTIAAGVPAKIIKQREPSMSILSPFGWYDITELNK